MTPIDEIKAEMTVLKSSIDNLRTENDSLRRQVNDLSLPPQKVVWYITLGVGLLAATLVPMVLLVGPSKIGPVNIEESEWIYWATYGCFLLFAAAWTILLIALAPHRRQDIAQGVVPGEPQWRWAFLAGVGSVLEFFPPPDRLDHWRIKRRPPQGEWGSLVRDFWESEGETDKTMPNSEAGERAEIST